MKRLTALLLTIAIISVSMLTSCVDNVKDNEPEETRQNVEETTDKASDTTEDETTEEETTQKETEVTTAKDTANAVTTAKDTTATTTAQTPPATEDNSNQGSSSGGSIDISGSISGGSSSGSSSGGSSSGGTAASDGIVPVAASTKDAYPATVVTRTGKKLVHTYSDRAIGTEDNSTTLSYMPMMSSTAYHDPNGTYNVQKVLLRDIKPGLISDGVMVGYDGYMFYGDTLADFQGEGFLHSEIYNRAVSMLKERNEWAEKNGKKFYFVIAPNKNTVYPDYMPDGYTLASYRRYDQFVALLKSAGITAVDLRETMSAAVKATPERNLYYKYDTHWNNHAGFLAYLTTMNMIKKDFPNVVIHQKSDYQINYCETYMKDQAYYLGHYDYFRDYGPVYTLKGGQAAKLTKYVAREGWGQFAFAYECTSGLDKGYSDKLYWLQYTNEANTSAPNVYVMRDSYSIAMIPFLKDSFYMSTYNWTFAFDKSEILDSKADVILCIVAERNLKSYVNNKATVD